MKYRVTYIKDGSLWTMLAKFDSILAAVVFLAECADVATTERSYNNVTKLTIEEDK